MVAESTEPVAARWSFRRNDIPIAQDHLVERLIGDTVPSEVVVQQSVRAAINECKNIAAVYYCTRDGEHKSIDCRSLSRGEISLLVKGLGTNVSKKARRNAKHHSSHPSVADHHLWHQGTHSVEEDRQHSSRRLSDGSDSSSSNGSDSKRKRSERDDSVPPSFKEQRRRMSQSTRDESASSNSAQELGSDKHPVQTTDQLRIGDEDAVHEFFVRRFKDLQQSLCKAIAKPWIKMINPNKQTKNPYAGGTDASPWWWPERPPPGTVPTLKNGFVRHKEPDHLKMQERLTLLPCILELVINPPANDARADEIRKINLKEFQRMTYEQLSDKLNDTNLDKKQVLDEIFAAAFQLQRYKRGLIDARCRLTISNYENTRRGESLEDDYCDIKPDVAEEGGEVDREANYSSTGVNHPPALPSPGDHEHHGLPNPTFNLDAGRTALGVREPPLPSFQPQAATNELSYGPNYNVSLSLNEGLYPSRTSGTYPQPQALQDPPRRNQVTPPNWYLGANQYLSNPPMTSQLMEHSPGQCQSFSSTVGFPLPQGGPYLPSLPLPAICLSQQELFSEVAEIPRLCEVNRPLGKEGIGGRGGTLRLPYRHHSFQDYLPNPAYSSSPKQVNGGD